MSIKPLILSALAWAVPGAGHLWQGAWRRGLAFGAIVWSAYLLGLFWGGHLFGLHNANESGLLAYVFGFCDLGTGLIYWGSIAADVALVDQARRATAEYGNLVLMLAGLLNYLVMLDAYDIAIGRKR